jgi:hypothetical protein
MGTLSLLMFSQKLQLRGVVFSVCCAKSYWVWLGRETQIVSNRSWVSLDSQTKRYWVLLVADPRLLDLAFS